MYLTTHATRKSEAGAHATSVPCAGFDVFSATGYIDGSVSNIQRPPLDGSNGASGAKTTAKEKEKE